MKFQARIGNRVFDQHRHLTGKSLCELDRSITSFWGDTERL